MLNFSATIVAAGMLGVCAHAASDAFAAHRLALESIVDGEQNTYGHHSTRLYEGEHYPYAEAHDVYLEAPAHDEYDAFDHDYDTDRSKHISYRHQGDEEFHTEYSESCGVRDYCHRFSKMLSRDQREYKGHHEYRRGEEYEYDHHNGV